MTKTSSFRIEIPEDDCVSNFFLLADEKCKMHLSPAGGGLGSCPFEGSGSVVVDLLFNVLPIVCGGSVFVFVLLCITLCPLL